MPQAGTPYTIPFGAAGMVPQPNRWRAQAGELSLAENVVLENDLLQKEPTAAYYNVSGPNAGLVSLWPTAPLEFLHLSGQLVNTTGPQARAGVAAWFPSTTAVPPQAVISAFASIAAVGATWTLPLGLVLPGAGVSAGAHVLALARSGTAGTALATAVHDSAGNAYTLLVDSETTYFGTKPTWRVQLWGLLVTNLLPTGTTVTATLGATGMPCTAVAQWYSDVVSLTPIAAPALSAPATAPYTFATDPATAGGPEFTRPHTYPLRGIAAVATDNDPAVPAVTTAHHWSLGSTPPANASGHLLNLLTLFYPSAPQGIIAQTEWNSLRQKTPAGTVGAVFGSNAVAGSGTHFLTDVKPGDLLIVGGLMKRVAAVTSDTALTVDGTWEMPVTAGTYQVREGPVLVTAALHDAQGNYFPVLFVEQPANNAHGLKGNLTAFTRAQLAPSAMRRGRFVAAGQEQAAAPRKLFYLDGVHPVQVLSAAGGNFAPIAKPYGSWSTADADPNKQPTNAILHFNALWVFGNANSPHEVAVSNMFDHEDFQTLYDGNSSSLRTDGYVLNFFLASGVGERLWGAAEFQGVLFFWKFPIGIFYFDDTDPQPENWQVKTRSTSLGCAPSPYAVLATDDDVLFVDPTGHLHLLSAVATLGGTADSDLTRLLGLQRWTELNVDLASLNQMTSVFDTGTKTAWFGMRSTQAVAAGNLSNDLIVRVEFGNPGVVRTIATMAGTLPAPRITTARCWAVDALCMKHIEWVDRAVPVISAGNQSYMVVPLQYGSRTDHDFVATTDTTVGVPSTVVCSEDDFDTQDPGKLRHVRKRFTTIEVVAQNESLTQPVTLFLAVDNVVRQTLTIAQANRRRIMRKLNVGDGYTIAVGLRTDGSVAQDLPLLGCVVYYRPTGTDASRKS